MTMRRSADGGLAIDVAELPDHAFGHHGLIWWGTAGFMVIEGSMFIIVLIAYFYLRLRVPDWPPSLPHPSLTPGVIGTVILLVSCIPNYFTKFAAEEYNLRRVPPDPDRRFRRWEGEWRRSPAGTVPRRGRTRPDRC